MKTKYKYIHFVPGADETVWTIWNTKSDDYLGTLEYNKRWKEWESHPEPNTGWTAQCHLDVADFIKQLPTTKGGRVQPQVIVKFAEVEEEIETRMVGKIIKGNLNGQKVAEQWINVNNAILIAKQIMYKYYSKFSE